MQRGGGRVDVGLQRLLQSLWEENPVEEAEAERLVLAEETKQSAQATSFLQKAKNVTIIAKVKEIHSFLPGLELGMT